MRVSSVIKGKMLVGTHLQETTTHTVSIDYKVNIINFCFFCCCPAAHVELLQIRQFSECTGVDVRIIECWEINEGNHCPDVGKCITIPTCTGCPTISPLPGDHLLIAGVWQTVKGKKMVILPNSKQTGLFSIWKDKYANVEQWIQRIRK